MNMHAYSHAFLKRKGTPQAKVRQWTLTRAWSLSSQLALYLDDMAPTLEVRRENFANWVTRVLAHALATRGLTPKAIAKIAGIGSQTIYRWKNGSWEKDGPKPDQLVAFCDALDIGTVEPFSILWPGKNEKPAAGEPLTPMDPDLQLLLRKLADPNVSPEEKYFIREYLALLAARADRAERPGRVIPRRKSS